MDNTGQVHRVGKLINGSRLCKAGALLFVAVFLSLALAGTYFVITKAEAIKRRSFTVRVDLSRKVRPSVAVIELYVVDEGGDLKELHNSVTRRINKIYDLLKQVGIEKGNIKTLEYSVSPKYDYQNANKIVGYKMEQGVQVRVQDIGKVSDILQNAVEYGANRVVGPYFEVPDREKIKGELLIQSIRQAKEKAVQIAQTAGFKIIRVVDVKVVEDFTPVPVYRVLGTGPDEAPARPVVEPGEQTVGIKVDVEFEIK